MTNQYYDTDCLSSFLWVHEEKLLAQTDALISSKNMQIISIGIDSRAFELYQEMTVNPDQGIMPIGRGEAAALALAIVNGGMVASNNLRDVVYYASKYSVQVITTGQILTEALNQGLINESKGNQIWQEMLKKRRMLPTSTFSEYLQIK